jgi:hypothetical protein
MTQLDQPACLRHRLCADQASTECSKFILEAYVPIILKRISLKIYLLCLLPFYALPSLAADLLLPVNEHERIVISVRNSRVSAKDLGENIAYDVDRATSNHMKQADDIELLEYRTGVEDRLFVVLVRKFSRPGRMGQGHCGAGYEDYLLLIEPSNRKVMLRDELLLQSCLEGKLIDHDTGEDDPTKLLIAGKNNSLYFRWESDDENRQRRLTVKNGRFRLTLVQSDEQ